MTTRADLLGVDQVFHRISHHVDVCDVFHVIRVRIAYLEELIMVLITLYKQSCVSMAWLYGCFLHHSAVFSSLYTSLWKEVNVEAHT